MSTDLQDQSIDIQAEAIDRYARRRGFEIVRTFRDDGRSGLTITGRPGLQQLMAEVTAGRADFAAILAFDVSRWGRFQDTDESAHYEFLCRQMGINVHYCAELFENDGSSLSSLLKAMKRVMAAEYSRELSAKIHAGQTRLAGRGFRVSGSVPYGMRRVVVSADGEIRRELQAGEAKYLKTDRVILAPGPAHEVEVVRRIFHHCVFDGLGLKETGRRLNADGERTRNGVPWHQVAVRLVLENEAYIGTNIWGRERRYSLQKKSPAPRDEWICVPGAFEPIVDAAVFAMARRLRAHRAISIQAPTEELLERLRALIDDHADIARPLLYKEPDLFMSAAYRVRFGSMRQAFERIGFDDLPRKPRRSNLPPRNLRWRLLDELMAELRSKGTPVTRDDQIRHLLIGTDTRVAVILVRTHYQRWTRPPWMPSRYDAAATLLVRTWEWQDEPADYYLIADEPLDLPDLPPPAVEPMPRIERYRLGSLDRFYEWAAGAAL